MGDSAVRARIRDHAKAFDGLLSLIPAKMYYGEDTSDQWKKEKQTKQEAAAARRAKLDPDSALNRSAKEVLDERARNKRKLRQLEQEEQELAQGEASEAEEYEPVEGVASELPGQGLKKKLENPPHQKSRHDGDDDEGGVEAEESQNDETPKLSKKEAKRQAKREKKAERRAEEKSKKATRVTESIPKSNACEVGDVADSAGSNIHKGKKVSKISTIPILEATEGSVTEFDVDGESQKLTDGLAPLLDIAALQKEEDGSAVSALDSGSCSPIFDNLEVPDGSNIVSNEITSTSTSISSTVPPSEKPKHLKIPADTSALRARLAAKIEALRAARKADGTNGKPIRTRQELIEARRAKETQRKEHKKELRRLAKLEEERKREEALASNSPRVMSPRVDLDEAPGNFSFGRVAFADGAQMSHDLSYFLNRDKKKGPSDPKTALLKVQNQKKRFEELEADKRKDIEDKETWLNARRRVEGEKIRDDEAILKKSIKRKEVAKKKSEKAWKDRASGVALAQKEKQKKREENIKKRREDKLLHRSGKRKKSGAVKKKKKGGRPGFEGSLGVVGRK